MVCPPSYACYFDDSMADQEMLTRIDFEDEVEPGSSCYVDHTDVFFAVETSSGLCEGEEDGSWGTDAPEGLHLEDHPDDQPTPAFDSWKTFSLLSKATFDLTPGLFPAVHRGANYPPPQR